MALPLVINILCLLRLFHVNLLHSPLGPYRVVVFGYILYLFTTSIFCGNTILTIFTIRY